MDVNAVDNFGNTALHQVVDGLYPMQGERTMARVNILIDAGAHINATDKDGMTVLDRFLEGLKIPFMKRETYKEEMSAMLKLLLSHGAKTAEQLKAERK